ncbi:MAG: hypothetical protein J6P65_01710 [Bacteroidales bacterium]|nr:hypothetical protein [Bacteroidales bacterium]
MKETEKIEITVNLHEYLRKGFGSMNKNDFEVFIFNELLKEKYADKSDNAISRELKIPESKVKRLRYEAELVYGNSDYYKEAFYSILHNRIYKSIDESNKIQFSIKNKALRLYLDDMLEAHGSFADSSFNSDIVTITIPDLLLLLADFEGKDDLIEKIKESLKESSQSFPPDLKDKCKGLVKGVFKDVASHYAPETLKALEKFFETPAGINDKENGGGELPINSLSD